jgi:predicted permease
MSAETRPVFPGATVLEVVARLVPESHRDEWLAEWRAEGTHAWRAALKADRGDAVAAWSLRARCLGGIMDALWLRRRHGTTIRRTSMFAHDVRFAARTLLRRPTFTTIVVTTLALCIGANTTIFSVVNSVLLNGLPYSRVDGLVAVYSNDTKSQRDRNQISVGDYEDWRARSRTLAAVAGYFPNWTATYTGGDVAERITAGVVSANFLPVLGVAPRLGRAFSEAEDKPGSPKTVILTHAFWSRVFSEDPAIVGKTITLEGAPYTVVGVMGSAFAFPGGKVDVLAPLPMLGNFLVRREVHLLNVIARLRDGVPVDAAYRELDGIAAQLREEHPRENAGFGVTVVPLRTAILGDVRRPILLLFSAVCAVLLIGCANVANLMLGRAGSRRQELAVRVAMGAEPGVIARQLLTESALIAVVAGAIGSVLAVAGTRALSRIVPPSIGRIADVQLDGRVFAFTLVASITAALLCGLAPALSSARGAAHPALQESTRGMRTRRRRRFQSGLVVGELALSLVLVVSAGLLINSFMRLAQLNPGFRTDHLVKVKVSLPSPAYGNPIARGQFQDALLARARELPGVRSIGAVSRFPLHDNNITTKVLVEGADPATADPRGDVDLRSAAGDYFAAMGIPVIAGRAFTTSERTDSGSTPVAIVNRAASRLLFGDQPAVGRRVSLGGQANGPFFEVVGVVGDIHDASLRDQPRPQIYTSAQQTMPGTLSYVARVEGATVPALTGLREAVKALDPRLPIYDVQTIDDVMTGASLSDRFTTTLLAGFSMLALLLAALGTYGVIAQSVSERTREIGLRIALGAQSAGVLRMVLREGLVLLGVALPLALAGIWVASNTLRSLLFGVTPADPITVSVALLTLAGATLVACYLPARRAARVDPMVAMRVAD